MTVLFVQVTACGTVLYPERRGQSAAGGIDVKIALLDGAGLLFGLIPGIIAFAVDFNNGAIYLPANGRNSFTSGKRANGQPTLVSDNGNANYRVIQVSKDQLTETGIEQIIYQETGTQINLRDNNVQLKKLDNMDELKTPQDFNYVV